MGRRPSISLLSLDYCHLLADCCMPDFLYYWGCCSSISRLLPPSLPVSSDHYPSGCYLPVPFRCHWAAANLVAGCCLPDYLSCLAAALTPAYLSGLQPIYLDCSSVVGRLLPAEPWPLPAHLHVGLCMISFPAYLVGTAQQSVTEASMIYSKPCGVISTTVYGFG